MHSTSSPCEPQWQACAQDIYFGDSYLVDAVVVNLEMFIIYVTSVATYTMSLNQSSYTSTNGI